MKRRLLSLLGLPVLIALGTAAALAAELVQAAPSLQTLKALALLRADSEALAASKTSRIALGDIDLADGHIVAADPLTLFGAERSFTTIVPPGHYPVFVYARDTGGGDVRIGLAELRFSDAAPTVWMLAATSGQDVTTLKEDEFFGYGVDAGLGSFMSPETVKALEADMKKAEAAIPDFSDYYTNVLAKDLDKATPNAIVFPVPSSPANRVAIFHSGWGDGHYPSYFGFDAAGNAAALVTTFFVLEDES